MAMRGYDQDAKGLPIEGASEETPSALTPEQEARIEASLASASRGDLVSADDAHARLRARLRS